MPENTPSDQTPQVASASDRNADNNLQTEPVSANGGTRKPTRYNNRFGNVTGSTPRDFEGDTPKLGGVLGLRSENITKKISYDLFCEKLGTYIMTEFKNGDAIFQVTKEHDSDVVHIFKDKNKPKNLTDEEKKDSVDVEIHKEPMFISSAYG